MAAPDRLLHGKDPLLDLAVVEADALEVEVELEIRQHTQVLAQEFVVPGADLRQAVVGDHQGPDLHIVEIGHPHRRDTGHAQQPARLHACVAADQPGVPVHHHGDPEAEGLDAPGDVADLLLCMEPGIARVGDDGVYLDLLNAQFGGH